MNASALGFFLKEMPMQKEEQAPAIPTTQVSQDVRKNLTRCRNVYIFLHML
jgi:hypothetical protein